MSITNIPIQKNDLKTFCKTKIHQEWIQIWLNTQSNKLRTIKTSTSKWIISEGITRSESMAINRLRIGHTRLTHGYLMAKEQPIQCEICNTLLTVKHIITQCTKYEPYFRNHNEIELLQPHNEHTLKQILHESNLIELL